MGMIFVRCIHQKIIENCVLGLYWYIYPSLISVCTYTKKKAVNGNGNLWIVIGGIFLFISSGTHANNIRVSNATMTGQKTADGVTQVTFDLSWENSWRLDSLSANNNWDAAWVFVKYRLPVLLGGDGVWKHAKLTETGHKPGEGMQAAGGLLNPAAPFDIITNPALGVFIYRSIPGEGSINLENVELRWHYASAGLKDIEVVEIEVYAIEMVYVPRGGFFVGSGGTETESFTNGSWVSGASIPLEITSENALRIAKEPAAIWSTTALGISGSELPSTFPKGYEAFYIMKYSVSHGQYVEFLNTLTESQATTRRLLGENQFRHSLFVDDGIYRTDLPFVAKNYLSWSDGAAYLDWAGLRPMTELEYEKASRGTAVPVANEFAWGNTTIKAATTIVNSGAANETTSTAGANAVFSNRSNVQGPIRVGAFATTVSNRQPSGASFWGVMELSGNLWERTVSVGDEAGRDYTGQHGDGLLTELGNANVPQWPGQSIDGVTVATGTVIRGGAWISPVSSLRISDRIGATQPANSGRLNTFGLRGVRSSPTPIEDKTPIPGSLTNDAAYRGGVGDGADANRTATKNLSGLNLKIWTGGTPGNTTAWFAGANWFDKAVPGADDPILIPTTANPPVISGTSPGNDILKTGIFILKDGTSLTLEAGPVFTLGEQTDLITEGSASLILDPGSTYLNLSRSNPNLEVKQTISGEKGWRMLGVPVKDAVYRQFLSGLVSQGFSGSDYPGLQPNVLWFDETDGGTTLQGWRAPSSVDAAARLGRGHYLYVFNGATIPGRSEAYADSLPGTLNVKGIEHNLIIDSSFTFSVTYTPPPSSGFQQPNVDLPDYIEVATLSRGFNLIANPTASVIDFFREEAWTKKNLDNSIYIWDPAYGDGPRAGLPNPTGNFAYRTLAVTHVTWLATRAGVFS
nr:SUMF1/EgtB/PvdO family nonheme iron enzyme [Cytophagales bacterium]